MNACDVMIVAKTENEIGGASENLSQTFHILSLFTIKLDSEDSFKLQLINNYAIFNYLINTIFFSIFTHDIGSTRTTLYQNFIIKIFTILLIIKMILIKILKLKVLIKPNNQ